jgi:biopolymer transport protein ExbD
LISFFLVATTLKKLEKELPLELPQAAAAVSKQVEDKMTVVSIDRDGNLYLGSEPVGQGYLGRRLRELAGQNPQHRVRIDADRDAPVWAAVQVLDVCNFENLRNVGIRTKQKEG